MGLRHQARRLGRDPYLWNIACDYVVNGWLVEMGVGEPGIDLLERAKDFPKDGPLLIITDGGCDRLQIRRQHAWLLPQGRHLPFVPSGRVFRIV